MYKRFVPLRRTVCLAATAFILAGCAGSPSSAPPPPTPPATRVAAAIVARDERALRATSYTARYHMAARMPDGTVLLIFQSICTGSADGHCQAIDVFKNAGERPVWRRAFTGVLAIAPLPNGFTVKAVSYAPQDPLCCPSLPPVTDRYLWTGRGLSEHGPPPSSPQG